jgi:hypothetical protein
MKLRGRVIGAAAVAALAATLAVSAGASIHMQRGIAGVRIGMTRDQVKAVLGNPQGVKPGKNPFGRYTRYRYPNMTIFFQGNRTVTSVYTTSRAQRTPSGVGVGTTRKDLKAKIRGAHCRQTLGANLCWVGSLRPGRRVTTFYFNGNKIFRVAVGIVLD